MFIVECHKQIADAPVSREHQKQDIKIKHEEDRQESKTQKLS